MSYQSWNNERRGEISLDAEALRSEPILGLNALREGKSQQKVRRGKKPRVANLVEDSLGKKSEEAFLSEDTMQILAYRYGSPEICIERYLEYVSKLRDAVLVGSHRAMLELQAMILHNRNEDVRVIVVEALGTLGEQIPIVLLLLALRDTYWDVRAAAAQALGKLGKRTPVEHLIAHLRQEPDMSVREAIVRVLGQQGQAMPTDVIVDILLNDANWLVREAAAWALGQLEEYAPLPALVYALDFDPVEQVRAAAATSLGKTKKEGAMESLFDALEDPDSDVRKAASLALQQLDEEVIEPQLSYNDCPYNHLSLLNDLSLLKLKERFTSDAVFLSEVFQKQAEWQAFSRLREYIGGKRGGVEAELKDTDHGRVLLFQCFYEHLKEPLQETLLPSIQSVSKVESIEAALHSRDNIVQTAVQKALDVRKSSNWLDLLVVSFSVSCAQTEVEQAYSPLRVIVCSMGCRSVRKHDVLLDQLSEQWHDIVGESICERIQDLGDLRIWCQPVA